MKTHTQLLLLIIFIPLSVFYNTLRFVFGLGQWFTLHQDNQRSSPHYLVRSLCWFKVSGKRFLF